MEGAFFPGFWTGLVKGGKARENALNNLNSPVQKLVSLGFEQEVRNKLASEGLSPTEISERIHPLPENFDKQLKKLPDGPFQEQKEQSSLLGEPFQAGSPLGIVGAAANKFYKPERTMKTYDQVLEQSPKEIEKMNNRLAKFLQETITPDMSLAVLRHKLWKDKNYDWRQFGPALNKATKNGLTLTAAQRGELSEINSQAPRDSLSEIFTDWPRFIQYYRGNK